MIDFVSPVTGKKLHPENDFLATGNGEKFPVVNNIPRFVSADNYASAFGLQWKTFPKLQLDSFNKTHITQERLERCLGFEVEKLKDKNILEVGCGAGRFTELLVKGGGYVHSVDLSNAIEVNKENIGNAPNYAVAQASVYQLPFPESSFDIVLCLGVIQHTPSPEKTIEALWQKVKPGGMLVIDHYKWRIGYYSTLAPLYRAWLKRIKPARSKKIVNRLVNFFFPLHRKLQGAPAADWLLYRISPLIIYIKDFPQFDMETHYQWSLLDTYDSLTDYYKHLRTPAQIERTLKSLGATEISVWEGGNGVEARCRKK